MRPSEWNHDEEHGGGGMAWIYCIMVVWGSGRPGRREMLAVVRGWDCYRCVG